MATEMKKTPLSEAVKFKTDSYVRIFKVGKDIVEKNGSKVWINTDFKTNYQKDEVVAERFSIFAQSYGAFGVEIRITEEQLEGMLNHVREMKSKVFCIEGSI
jgi:hypothetical protein